MSAFVNSRHRSQKGFTIVELLIVIVVIAIIAAITIIAYTGVQQRASNSQTLSAVKAYKQGLMMYAAANNGAYPTASGCLGTGYPGASCWISSRSENATLMANLATVMGQSMPLPAFITYSGNSSYGGMFFAPNFVVDGQPTPVIAYMLIGAGTTCAVGPTITYQPSNMSTSAPNPNPSGAYPQCFIMLPSSV